MMKRCIKHPLVCSFLLIFALVSQGWADSEPVSSQGTAARSIEYPGLGNSDEILPFNSEVRTGFLSNGMRYYIQENSNPQGRAQLRLVVNAGSILEEEEERGLAHFVEHMAFNGTERFPKSELVEYLRSLGMRFGPEVNAYTSFNETVYGFEVPIEKGGGISKTAFAVLDDWTHAIQFRPEDVDAERLVIMAEYRSGLGAMDRIRRQLLPVILRGSPYAQRLPIGLPEIIQEAPAQRLKDFYTKWYRYDNMALVFIGDFDAEKLEGELEQHFQGNKPEQALERNSVELPEPEPGILNITVVGDDELPYGFVELYFKQPSKREAQTLGEYKEDIAKFLIQYAINSRFSEALSEEATPFAQAACGSATYGSRSGFFVMTAIPEPGSSEATLVELLRTTQSLMHYGLSEGEINRAKAVLLRELKTAAAEKGRHDSSMLLNAPTAHFLKGSPVLDPSWELYAAEQLLPVISKEELDTQVTSFFIHDDLSIVLFGPSAEIADYPNEARIRELFSMVQKEEPEAILEEEENTGLLSALPKQGILVEERLDSASGLTHLVFENGAELLYKQTQNKNDEIILSAIAKGGFALASEEAARSAELASALISLSGLGDHDRTELQRILSGSTASLYFWLNQQFRGFSGSSNNQDLETLFQLLYLHFQEPRIEDSAVQVLKDMLRTQLAQRKENPEAFFSDEVERIISDGHSRYKPFDMEDIDRISRNETIKFLQALLNPSDYVFVCIGNLDPKILKVLSTQYIASLPRVQSASTWKDLGMRRPDGTKHTAYRGAEAKALTYLAWFIEDVYSEEKAALGSVLNSYLEIRYIQEIRERMGAVYSISPVVQLSPAPSGEFQLSVSFVSDPERIDEIITAVQSELINIQKGQIDEETVKKAKEALIQQHSKSMEDNMFLAANYAQLELLSNSSSDLLEAKPDLYRAVTKEDLAQLANRILEKKGIEVRVLPEAYKK